jgi:nucleolar protein 9
VFSKLTAFQFLVKIESDLGEADEIDSFMDQVLAGLISTYDQRRAIDSPSDFVTTLIRDPVGSHTIEAIVTCCTTKVFGLIWDIYVSPQIVKLALHPTSNFIVAQCIQRLDENAYTAFMDAMQAIWPRIIRASRTGVLSSAIQRAFDIPTQQARAMDVGLSICLHETKNNLAQALCAAFELEENNCSNLVLVVLGLQASVSVSGAFLANSY